VSSASFEHIRAHHGALAAYLGWTFLVMLIAAAVLWLYCEHQRKRPPGKRHKPGSRVGKRKVLRRKNLP
jgi:lysylphosphatidylglycerol synthetase-like protein (DUF2156 family)